VYLCYSLSLQCFPDHGVNLSWLNFNHWASGSAPSVGPFFGSNHDICGFGSGATHDRGGELASVHPNFSFLSSPPRKTTTLDERTLLSQIITSNSCRFSPTCLRLLTASAPWVVAFGRPPALPVFQTLPQSLPTPGAPLEDAPILPTSTRQCLQPRLLRQMDPGPVKCSQS
jgi:hypothetical protein